MRPALRADLRRQGVAATRVKTQSSAFRSGGKVTQRGHRRVQPPAGHHDVGRHPHGAGLRDHRQRPREAGHAEAGARHQGQHRGRQYAARIAGQVSAVFRCPVRESGGGRRAGRRARDPARQDRHLQGEDRSPEEEDQEGAVLPGRGAGRRGGRLHHPADLRDSAVRGTVQGFRRRSAGVHADGGEPVPLRPVPGLVDVDGHDRRGLRLLLLLQALEERCSSPPTGSC